MHDRGRKGYVLARGHGEFLDVKRRSGLVIAEEQVPGLFVASIPLHCSGGGRVEHQHVRLVMSEDGAKIMPADRARPVFEKGLDADLFCVDGFRHGFDSFVSLEDERTGVNPTRVYGQAMKLWAERTPKQP